MKVATLILSRTSSEQSQIKVHAKSGSVSV